MKKGWKLIKKQALFPLLFMLVLLILCYLISSFDAADSQLTIWVNQVFPIVLFLSLAWTGWKLLQIYPMMIWSPLLWFLAACALYYGVGPLVYHFGNEKSIWYINHFYAVNEEVLLRTNLLNVIGISSVVCGFLLGSKMISFPVIPHKKIFNPKRVKLIVLLLLIIGISIKYLLVLPYLFGMLHFVLPGSLMQFALFVPLAIIPLLLLIAKGYKKWTIILLVLIVVELLVSLLTFAKIATLTVLIIVFLGLFSFFKFRRQILVVSTIAIVLVYLFIKPIVDFGRHELLAGTHSPVGLEQRFEIINSYFESNQNISNGNSSDIQGWWTRLSYSNFQAFTMDAYDMGKSSNSLLLALYTPIPRIIWPDKPIITIGYEFNYLVTGNPYSASAAGWFGEAYWNGGWLLVIVSGFYVGILFTVFTKYSIHHISNYNFIFLPIIFIGIKIGFRPDDWFAATGVGAPVIAFFLHYLIKFINDIMKLRLLN